jgi:hypothetical protein
VARGRVYIEWSSRLDLGVESERLSLSVVFFHILSISRCFEHISFVGQRDRSTFLIISIV